MWILKFKRNEKRREARLRVRGDYDREGLQVWKGRNNVIERRMKEKRPNKASWQGIKALSYRRDT